MPGTAHFEDPKIASQSGSQELPRLIASVEKIARTITPQEDQDRALRVVITSMLG